jgi:hypothetical protein
MILPPLVFPALAVDVSSHHVYTAIYMQGTPFPPLGNYFANKNKYFQLSYS